MSKFFYHYLMKYRNPQAKDEISQFANDAFIDHSFPKYSVNYNEISSYLEMNGHYLKNMSIFDQAWDLYISEE
ncbi:YozE family protein [Bacillus aquiflavi]|uniref:UPF0346 protein G4D64_10975 n=1 Tax=Bacillus aquiflavi TaxID=2672567 RepID=A0A6B3VVF9_9BACI|nr:YozE family protein [Bacillus aquiflavi]MBA4537753.1 YozE family protein [Bacillus aquiflavi]NEY82009.1 YozE family protein [Bacillus aquiflavi]UAC46938.1 YozE family protein [Bacillus aquiflavi]